MTLPRISIVMPSFNQEAYLEEAICSILNQDYPNLEFMVYDGGSSDKSPAIIEKYAKHLSYWRSEPDRGQSDAIVQGFARASGELLGWVNSDDSLLPRALEAIGRAYLEHPTAGLFGGNYLLVDQGGRITRCKRHSANAGWFARHAVFAFNPPGSFFKRQDYEAVGGLRVDLHFAMDNDLYLRLATQGTRYVHVQRYLSAFRQHASQKPTVYREASQAEMERLQTELWPESLRRYARQRRWSYLFRACQALNGNYLYMLLDTWRWQGRQWQSLSPQELQS